MKFTRTQVAILNTLITLSPLMAAGAGLSRMSGDKAAAGGMMLVFVVIPLVGMITVTGLLVTVLTRKSDAGHTYSLLAFGVPTALLLCIVLPMYLN